MDLLATNLQYSQFIADLLVAEECLIDDLIEWMRILEWITFLSMLRSDICARTNPQNCSLGTGVVAQRLVCL